MDPHEKINCRASKLRHSRAAILLARLPYEPIPKGCVAVAPSISFGPEHVSRRDRVRFVENVSRGLRVMGLAHDVYKRLGHTGWFIDPDGLDETMAGIIVRLPAKRGRNRYLIGYADPWNPDCALVDVDVITADKVDSGENELAYDLASRADRFAELRAESEREYQEADRNGRDKRQAMADSAETVRECLESLRNYRDTGIANPDQYEAACEAFESAWEAYREAAGEAFEAADYAKRHHSIGWRDLAP